LDFISWKAVLLFALPIMQKSMLFKNPENSVAVKLRIMEKDLSTLKCKPCEGIVETLDQKQIDRFYAGLSNGWKIIERHHLLNEMHFVNFRHTMNMVNKIAVLAESEGHHPDLSISFGTLTITIWTHAINGLSENDFILASKIDLL
jgi:4a-hydroxytetrahydrobiopterin dehydratase